MNNDRKPRANQYLDRNGNIRTRAIRHSIAQRKLEAKLNNQKESK